MKTVLPKKKLQTETRKLRGHENLVLITIKEQCGTLSKAILEGIMNSIDAQAENIAVTINSGRVTITDDGKGFASADSIREVFEVMGLPHERDDDGYSTDAEFGTFRIGRGQLFAFGKNRWRTNTCEMLTDIEGRGLEYTLRDGLAKSPGCVVEVELYNNLTLSEIQGTIDKITQGARYIRHNLLVNGQRVSVDPEKSKWDIVTDLAYIRKKESNAWGSNYGLDIYQQGVFVETIQARVFGLEGTVVIRDKVKLNTARNEVLRGCPRWKKISAYLKKTGDDDILKKSRLTSAEAERALQMMANKEMDEKAKARIKCLPDTNGKMWSVEEIRYIAEYKGKSGYRDNRKFRVVNGRIALAFGVRGCRQSDRVMQQGLGIVLATSVFNGLRMSKDEAFRFLFGKSNNIELQPLERLAKDISITQEIIPAVKYTKRQKAYMAAAASCMATLDYYVNGGWTKQQGRMLMLGESDTADGWTNGSTFIAIAKRFVDQLSLDQERGWVAIAHLLLHEMCHNDDDSDTHNHTPEFYELFHDSCHAIPTAARAGFTQYCQQASRVAKKLPCAVVNDIRRGAELHATELTAEFHEPVRKPRNAKTNK